MAQFARPDEDLVLGNWTVPSYDKIDETPYSDADYTESGLAPASDELEVGLSTVGDPVVHTGHIVRYRYGKDLAGGAAVDIHVRLLCGATEIATWDHLDVSEGFTDGGGTVPEGQAALITDYGDLRLEFVANSP